MFRQRGFLTIDWGCPECGRHNRKELHGTLKESAEANTPYTILEVCSTCKSQVEVTV